MERVSKWWIPRIVKFAVKAVWSVKLHLYTDSYLAGTESRAWMKNSFVRLHSSVPRLPGCGVASMDVQPAEATIEAGASLALVATPRDLSGAPLSGYPVAWATSDPSIASVSSSGIVQGVAPGIALVTAMAGGKTASSRITVTSPGGWLTGRVVDAETGAALAGASLAFRQSGAFRGSAVAGTDGSYTSPRLAAGTYEVWANHAGYVGVVLHGAGVEREATRVLETIPMVRESSSPGSISGSVRNARHNGSVPGATVELRSGMNATDGPLVATTTADGSGNYRFTGLGAGTYSIQARAGGFADAVQTGIVVGNRDVSGQNLSMSPLSEDITIVLRWGAAPRDLDSHLTGPTESGSRFHVYYAGSGNLAGSPYAALDIDDVSSYGPETITISRQFAGTYRYSIHDYSNRSLNPSTALATSGAQVKVYRGGTLLDEFYVPNEPGTLWTVFELEGNTLRAVNAMGYQSSPFGIQSVDETDARVIGGAVEASPKNP